MGLIIAGRRSRNVDIEEEMIFVAWPTLKSDEQGRAVTGKRWVTSHKRRPYKWVQGMAGGVPKNPGQGGVVLTAQLT